MARGPVLLYYLLLADGLQIVCSLADMQNIRGTNNGHSQSTVICQGKAFRLT